MHPSRWGQVEEVLFEGWASRFAVSDSRILAGCSVFHEGLFYLWFSTGLVQDRREGAMLLGVSEDGVTYRPHHTWQELEPDGKWYQSSQGRSSTNYLAWRDPFLFQDETSRNWLFFASDLPWNPDATPFKMCWPRPGRD